MQRQTDSSGGTDAAPRARFWRVALVELLVVLAGAGLLLALGCVPDESALRALHWPGD